MADLTGYESIAIEIEGPLALLTIRREAQLNALSTTVIAELTTAVGELELVDDVRVVAIVGAGDKAFVAGWSAGPAGPRSRSRCSRTR